MNDADTFRLIVCFMCGTILAGALIILYHYGLMLLRGYSGLRRWHIVLISSSYIGFAFEAGKDLVDRMGQPWSYRLPLYGYCAVSGLTSFVVIFLWVMRYGSSPLDSWTKPRWAQKGKKLRSRRFRTSKKPRNQKPRK